MGYYGAALAALAVLAAGPVAAAGYRYDTIVIPGAVSTTGTSINDHGVVAGYYYDYETIGGAQDVVFHGFVFDHGTLTIINAPGAVSTDVTGIGNDGTVVGYFSPAPTSGPENAFILKNGAFQVFGRPGYLTQLTSVSHDGAYAVAVTQSYSGRYFQISTAHHGVLGDIVLKGDHGYTSGINNNGVATGAIGTGLPRAVVIPQNTVTGRPERPRTLPFQLQAGASAEGINDSNTVVGTYFDEGLGMPLGYTGTPGGGMTKLAYPGAVATYADAINDAGDVLGTATLSGSSIVRLVYVLHGGVYTSLPGIPTTSFLFSVAAINASGQVLANTGSDIYVATPE